MDVLNHHAKSTSALNVGPRDMINIRIRSYYFYLTRTIDTVAQLLDKIC